jgi:hypothetical protein
MVTWDGVGDYIRAAVVEMCAPHTLLWSVCDGVVTSRLSAVVRSGGYNCIGCILCAGPDLNWYVHNSVNTSHANRLQLQGHCAANSTLQCLRSIQLRARKLHLAAGRQFGRGNATQNNMLHENMFAVHRGPLRVHAVTGCGTVGTVSTVPTAGLKYSKQLVQLYQQIDSLSMMLHRSVRQETQVVPPTQVSKWPNLLPNPLHVAQLVVAPQWHVSCLVPTSQLPGLSLHSMLLHPKYLEGSAATTSTAGHCVHTMSRMSLVALPPGYPQYPAPHPGPHCIVVATPEV